MLTVGEIALCGAAPSAGPPCGIRRSNRRKPSRPPRQTHDLCAKPATTTAVCGPPGPECATDAQRIKRQRLGHRDRAASWLAHVPAVPSGVARIEPARTGSHVPAAYVPATRVVTKRGKRVEVPDDDAPPDRWAPLPEPPEEGSITTFGQMESVDPFEERHTAATWALTVTQAGLVDLLNAGRKRAAVKPWTVWECAGEGGERVEFGPAEVFSFWRSVAQTGQPPPGMQRQIATRARMLLEARRLISRDKWGKRWWLHRPERPAPGRATGESVYLAIKQGRREMMQKPIKALVEARMAARKALWAHIRLHPRSQAAVLKQAEAGEVPVLLGARQSTQDRLTRLWRSWQRQEAAHGDLAPPLAPWSTPPRPPRPDRRLPQAELFGGKSCIGGRARARREESSETAEEGAQVP